jgi:hypothetical protein
VLVRFGRGELRNVSGWFGNDFRAALEGVEIPVFAHEIGQWSTYPDFSVIEKFTGYMRPSNYRIFRHIVILTTSGTMKTTGRKRTRRSNR